MPDITMCTGEFSDGKYICGAKDRCYRHMAKPDQWQAYWIPRDDYVPVFDLKRGCELFIALNAAGGPK